MAVHDDVAHFDRRAASYDTSWVQRYVAEIHAAMLDAVAVALAGKAPWCVLDIGCGTGRLLRAANTRWPQAELIGVDPAAGMVAIAQPLLPAAHFQVAPAEELPLPHACADVVLSSISLHHWADQGAGVAEAVRVLRPGGLFCLADIALPGWVARLLGSRALDARRLRRLMESSGVQVMRQERRFARAIAITLAHKP